MGALVGITLGIDAAAVFLPVELFVLGDFVHVLLTAVLTPIIGPVG